jgi:hypothetical protein
MTVMACVLSVITRRAAPKSSTTGRPESSSRRMLSGAMSR